MLEHVRIMFSVCRQSLLMLWAKQVVYGLHGVEGFQGNLNEDG